jgi:hypothetical protein
MLIPHEFPHELTLYNYSGWGGRDCLGGCCSRLRGGGADEDDEKSVKAIV